MKRFFVLLIFIFLAGCSRSAAVKPTMTDVDMATRVSLVLTAMPSPTGQVAAQEEKPTLAVTATKPLPTVAATILPTATQGSKPTLAATPTSSTPLPPTATATLAVTVAPTVAPPTATATANPTSTITPVPTATLPPSDPRLKFGSAAATDPLNDSKKWFWATDTDKFISVDFNEGAMWLTALTDLDGWRMISPLGHKLSDQYVETTVRTSTCAGTDHYGLVVRVNDLKKPDKGYLVGLNCEGQYSLRIFDMMLDPLPVKFLIPWTTNKAIVKGSNQANRLGVLSVDNRISIYANGILLGSLIDTTFKEGYFGVMVGSDNTPKLAVGFEEISVWENVK